MTLDILNKPSRVVNYDPRVIPQFEASPMIIIYNPIGTIFQMTKYL